jgi:hypothetical protein
MASDLKVSTKLRNQWRQIFQVTAWQRRPKIRNKMASDLFSFNMSAQAKMCIKWRQIFQVSTWQRRSKIRNQMASKVSAWQR